MSYAPFAKAYKAAGNRYAFGIPGGGPSLELADALIGEGIDFISTGHEATAALMAGALHRTDSTVSISLSIKGPGFANMAPGILCNRYEGNAAISISEAYPQNDNSGRVHKSMDHKAWTHQCAKAYTHWQDNDDFYSLCAQTASASPPAPVHIDLVAGQEKLKPQIEPTATNILPGEIDKSNKPILIIGQGASDADFTSLNIPVFSTPAAKGSLPESHPSSAGVYTGADKPDAIILFEESDLVIFLGVSSGELLTPKLPHSNTQYISIADNGSYFPKNHLSKTGALISHAGIVTLLNKLSEKDWGLDSIAKNKKAKKDALLDIGYTPASLQYAFNDINSDCIHVLDTGNFTVTGEHCLLAKSRAAVIGTPNGRYMGAGIGYALGAALNKAKQPTVLWIGDGGIRAHASELRIATERKLPLLVMHMRDGFYGSIRPRAIAADLNQGPLEVNPCSPRYFEALGMAYSEASETTNASSQIESWLKNPSPHLIDCPFDPDKYAQAANLLR